MTTTSGPGRGPNGVPLAIAVSPILSARIRARDLEAIQAAAVTAFQTLHLRDYARFDFRITADGVPYLIEANPNPYLHSNAEFIRAARASGRTHPGTIREIVGLALSRYGLSV